MFFCFDAVQHIKVLNLSKLFIIKFTNPVGVIRKYVLVNIDITIIFKYS